MTTYSQLDYERAADAYRQAYNNMAHAKHEERKLSSWYPERGMVFKVIRGRKFPIGTVETADAIGTNDFGDFVRFTRDGETKFIAARNVEWPNYVIKRENAYATLNDAEEALKMASKLVVRMAGIDLGKPLNRIKYEQAAYSDISITEYACNADAPDAILNKALGILDPSESSWGRLRWSGGSSVHARPAPNRVHVLSSVCLCD